MNRLAVLHTRDQIIEILVKSNQPMTIEQIKAALANVGMRIGVDQLAEILGQLRSQNRVAQVGGNRRFNDVARYEIVIR